MLSLRFHVNGLKANVNIQCVGYGNALGMALLTASGCVSFKCCPEWRDSTGNEGYETGFFLHSRDAGRLSSISTCLLDV